MVSCQNELVFFSVIVKALSGTPYQSLYSCQGNKLPKHHFVGHHSWQQVAWWRLFLIKFDSEQEMYLEYCTTLTVRSFTIVMQKALFKKFLQFSRDGAVVRALVFHQRVPGSIPEPGVIRGWSLLLPSLLCWFFSGYSGFPSPQQSTFPNSNSSLESVPN